MFTIYVREGHEQSDEVRAIVALLTFEGRSSNVVVDTVKCLRGTHGSGRPLIEHAGWTITGFWSLVKWFETEGMIRL